MAINAHGLRDHLTEQRWFGGRGRRIASVEVLDEATLDDGPPTLVVALIEVWFADGGKHLYHAPLLVDELGAAVDAFTDVQRLRVIGDLMAHGQAVKGAKGAFYFGGAGLDPLTPPGSGSIRVVEAEQSNTSVVLDEAVIVKFFRRVEPGIHPELEIMRLLTNEGFEYIPAQVGEIAYEGELEMTIDLGIAQHYVQGAVDGWAEVLQDVHRLYDEIHPEDVPEDMRLLTEERSAEMLDRLEQLGEATAAMHVMLSREEMEPDFVPEPIITSDLNGWGNGVRSSYEDLLTCGVGELSPLKSVAEALIDSFVALGNDIGAKVRVHGDYHLGQVLSSKREWLIIDFEGEPARPLEVRRTKQSALRDVAGMLRSFQYAALVPAIERTEEETEDRTRLERWAGTWEELARERFLAGYLRKSHEGAFIAADRDQLAVMLQFFELEKALYEIGYEQAHRPHWMRIPVRGVVQLLDRVERR